MMNVSGYPLDLNRTNELKVKSSPSNVKNAPINKGDHSSVSLSDLSKARNNIYEKSLSRAEKNKIPTYLTLEKRTEMLSGMVKNIVKEAGSPFSDDEVKKLVGDLKIELNIKDFSKPNFSAPSVNRLSFLKEDDKIALGEAYDYALNNGTSIHDVDFTASALSRQREIEAMRSQGIMHKKFNPDTDGGILDPSSLGRGVGSVHHETKYVSDLRAQLDDNSLFSTNPHLDNDLFINAIIEMLPLRRK